MSTRVETKPRSLQQDANSWRRFLTKSPPLRDLLEIRRLHDNKLIMRQRGEFPTFRLVALDRAQSGLTH